MQGRGPGSTQTWSGRDMDRQQSIRKKGPSEGGVGLDLQRRLPLRILRIHSGLLTSPDFSSLYAILVGLARPLANAHMGLNVSPLDPSLAPSTSVQAGTERGKWSQ